VALGNPKQELWAQRNRGRLKTGVIMGVGGTFNFIAHNVKRAPLWMQRSGMEWIYRIIQEPRRLIMRYATGLVVFNRLALSCILWTWLGKWLGAPSAGHWKNAIPCSDENGLWLDGTGLSFLDNDARAAIVAAHLEAERQGKPLQFRNFSFLARKQLRAHRLNY
jgi:hypothetical protein